ncbi:hypothetical protein L1987_00791 [Smallanthus sonchifolius]|uniref:Uncharacterized protein n=1 Tax=Smallanthus sonchifolius TaxID=185202 RepID=A0ACB9K381_9ASTR|nr:hypothetical protein L1987_00791 [Smallanthus sonchifolius]
MFDARVFVDFSRIVRDSFHEYCGCLKMSSLPEVILIVLPRRCRLADGGEYVFVGWVIAEWGCVFVTYSDSKFKAYQLSTSAVFKISKNLPLSSSLIHSHITPKF